MFENDDYLSNSNYKEGMLENRELLMQFSMSNELKITNTTLQKNKRGLWKCCVHPSYVSKSPVRYIFSKYDVSL